MNEDDKIPFHVIMLWVIAADIAVTLGIIGLLSLAGV